MYILLIILFILQLIFNIYFLIKSIKTKDKRNWLLSFSVNLSSLISVVLIGGYSLINEYLAWDSLKYLALCFLALCFYLFLLVLHFIFKMIEVRRNKKQNITQKSLEKKTKIKVLLTPFILTTLLTMIICGFDYSKCIIQKRGELNTYNNVKSKEISKMANFLNEKYHINIQESDCVYYREQDYTRHSDIFGNGSKYNIPYITVFKNNNEFITVVDRKGFIADNKQLKELNDILINYYYQKTGIKYDYIEFSKSYGGSWCGNDNVINTVLQTKFNTLITDENIEQFLNYVLQESDLSITFYIKNHDKSNVETLKYNIINSLDYLKKYTNIEDVKVYGYVGQLDIKHEEIQFPQEQKSYGNLSDDFNDAYKFGCYYIDKNSNNLTFSLSMDLNRNFTNDLGKLIDE